MLELGLLIFIIIFVMRPTSENILVVSCFGSDHGGILAEIARVCANCGCSIDESQMKKIGGEICSYFKLSGSWSAIAKMETSIPTLEERIGCSINAKRTVEPDLIGNVLPIAIQVVAENKVGIVNKVVSFFNGYETEIIAFDSEVYQVANVKSLMFALNMTLIIPNTFHVANLREKFIEYCDSHNLDAILEPVKL